MVNQTSLGTDENCPERYPLADSLTSWDLEVKFYDPPIYPDFSLVQARLAVEGFVVAQPEDLHRFAKLSNKQAMSEFGEVAVTLRHPLGRTGINGTGALWKAGASSPADMAVTRFNTHPLAFGVEIALVFNRGVWHLPGGFPELSDADWQATALREAKEEIGLDLGGLAADGHLHTLQNAIPKEQSRRSADLAYIANPIAIVHLPDPSLGNDIKAGSDAEKADWFTRSALRRLKEFDQISADHYSYALDALSFVTTLATRDVNSPYVIS